MSKAVEAEYLAEEGLLKLASPLDGISDHEQVRVVVERTSATRPDDWPTLDDEAGRELAQEVREAFGRDNIAV
jgi:hypothetical protein